MVLERTFLLSAVNESYGRKNSVIMDSVPCLVSKRNPLGRRVFNSSIAIPSMPLQPIQKIHILGERNSGTKYVGKLLRVAFSSRYSTPGPKDELSQFTTEYERNIPVFKFKHMFRHDTLYSTELSQLKEMTNALWLLVVRNPCDWVDAMYRKPWHLCPPNKSIEWCANQTNIDLMDQTLGMTRKQFLQQEWSDWQEVRHQHKRDKMYYYLSYHNIFALRQHKLQFMLQLMELHPHNVQVVHLKDVSRRPDIFLIDLIRDFQLQVSPRLNVTARTNSKPKSSICLPAKEWAVAQQEIDWELEAQFGFTRLDCRLCAA